MNKILLSNLFFFLMIFLLAGSTASAADTSVCIECHGGLSGQLGEIPTAEWHTSVHAAHRVSCHDCHGGDPTDYVEAMSPDRGFIGVPGYAEVPAFCGRCHVGVEEDYRASLHGQMLEFGGPNCVSCHESHAVQVATIDLINEVSCSRCHTYEKPALIKQEISDTEEMLSRLEASIASLYRVGFDTGRLQDELFSTRNNFRRLFHSVDIEKIRSETAGFDADLAETKATVDELEETLGQRKLAGGALVLLLILGGCVALLIRRTYENHE
ncbi:MAG: cytochrome c3 family protein [Pelovirga sp.]